MADKKKIESKYIIFNLGQEEFGIEIKKVIELQELFNITRVPKTPDYLKGVINLRGEIIPIIDLRKRLNLESIQNTEDTRIIILDMKEIVAGIIVDSSSEVLSIDKGYSENVANFTSKVSTELVLGIIKVKKRNIIILDFEKVITI
ncbi:MAG: chemotaxis protein CheW [Clostridia bacterium]|jgi:purine-binding chemotaxis protein CheW